MTRIDLSIKYFQISYQKQYNKTNDFSEQLKNPKNLQNKAWIGIIISVLFYTILVILSGVNEIIETFNKIQLEYYLIIFPLSILGDIIRSYRFNILLQKLGIKLNFKNYFLIYLAGTSMAITPGGMGSIIKSHILKRKVGKSFSSTLPIAIFEKWIDLAGIIIIVAFLLFWVDFLESKIVLIIGIVFLVITFILFKKKSSYIFAKNIIGKIKFLNRFLVNFEEVQTTSNMLFTKRTIIQTLPLSLVHKGIVILIIFLIFKSFNLDFDIFLSGQIFYTSSLIGALSFIPGGILVVEAGLLGLLLKIGLVLGTASSLVLTIRFVTMWFHTIIGFIALKFALQKD